MMRIAFALSLFFVSCTTALAQKSYFLFIQSDARQPFYVRLGDQTFSSSATGHLIIPGLKDSSYRVTLGFPRNQFPEQHYSVMFNQSDLALDLKKTEGSGDWKLFNTQSNEWLPVRQDLVGTQEVVRGERKKDNGFAALMAAVVNDSSVLYTSVVRTAPVMPSQQPVAKTTDPTPAVANVNPVVDSTSAVSPSTAAVRQEVKQSLNPASGTADSSLKTASNIVDTTAALAQTDSNMNKAKPSDSLIAVNTKPVTETGKTVVAQVGPLTEGQGKKLIYTDSTANGIDTIAIVIDLEPDSLLAAKKPVVTDSLSKLTDTAKQTVSKPGEVAIKTADTALAAGLKANTPVIKDTVPITDNRKEIINDTAIANVNVPEIVPEKKAAVTEKKEGSTEAKKDVAGKKEDTVAKQEQLAIVKKEDPVIRKGEQPIVKKEEPTLAKKEETIPVKQEPVTTDAAVQVDTAAKKGTAVAAETEKPKKLIMFNSDCQLVASEQDVDRLRIRIMAETNLDGRLNASRKFYRTKCLITKQVKALSELFLNDEERFRFFETSYPHVYDTANYKQLINLLTEEAYISQFRTLVKM